MPASTPVATGSSATASARSEREREPAAATITIAAPQIASRSTSPLICARASTAKLPAPETIERRPASAVARARGRSTERCERSAAGRRGRRRRRAWSRSARRAARVRETQTPSLDSSARCAGVSASAMRTRLAGRVAQQDRLDDRAGRRAQQRGGLIDRVAQALDGEAVRVDRRAQQVAVLEQEAAGVGPGCGRRRCAPTRSAGIARSARASSSAPRSRGFACRRRRRLRCRSGPGARPRRSSAGRAAPPARRVGADGRNAERSAT